METVGNGSLWYVPQVVSFIERSKYGVPSSEGPLLEILQYYYTYLILALQPFNCHFTRIS